MTSFAPRNVWSFFAHASMRRHELLMLCVLSMLTIALAGCGPKSVNVNDPFATVGSNGSLQHIWLPDDDGIPLTPAEVAAFNSTGDFDRNLTPDQLRDVLIHFKFLVHKNRRTVEVGVKRSHLYMPYIRKALAERKLPSELAYLPFIESNYNVTAVSYSGASGLWQFMPRTGKYFGLTRTPWFDERGDPYAATGAALTYLAKLNGLFDDWHLAISAYNAGEGKISRSMAEVGARTFFELRDRSARLSEANRMTDENRQYLPKFLAACKILRNLELLGFASIDATKQVPMAEISVKPGTDLMALAQASGMEWNEFMRHNAAFLRYISPPDRTTKAYVPQHMTRQALAVAQHKPSNARQYMAWKPYTIKSGDNLSAIARRNKTTVAELQRINQLHSSIKPGQDILVPPAPKAQPQQQRKQHASKQSGANSTLYRVKEGDTVWAIARKFNVNPKELLAVNGMDMSARLQPGDTVKVVR